MSLLLDALKNAAEKKQTAGQTDEQVDSRLDLQSDDSLELIETASPPPTLPAIDTNELNAIADEFDLSHDNEATETPPLPSPDPELLDMDLQNLEESEKHDPFHRESEPAPADLPTEDTLVEAQEASFLALEPELMAVSSSEEESEPASLPQQAERTSLIEPAEWHPKWTEADFREMPEESDAENTAPAENGNDFSLDASPNTPQPLAAEEHTHGAHDSMRREHNEAPPSSQEEVTDEPLTPPEKPLAMVEQPEEKHPEAAAAVTTLLQASDNAARKEGLNKGIFFCILALAIIALLTTYYLLLLNNRANQPAVDPTIGLTEPADMPVLSEQLQEIVPTSADTISKPVFAETSTAPTAASSTPVPSTSTPKAESPALAQAEATPVATPPVQTAEPTTAPRQSTADVQSSGRTTTILRREAPQITPLSAAIQSGYQAYQQGDIDSAERWYREALALDDRSRDALLGAAAVAARRGDNASALRYYQRRLAADPRDEYARAGILSVAQQTNDSSLLSSIQTLQQDHPEAAHLHFMKGGVYAKQGQWAAAQEAYFAAFQADSSQADYAFNLAVALDHMNQPQAAASYYQRALALAPTSASSFTPADLSRRLQQLQAGEQP